MKILHVINNLGSGGAEKLTVQICNELSQTHDIGLFLMNNDSDFFRHMLSGTVKAHEGKSKSRFSIKLLFNLYRTVRQYDIIHGHLFPVLYYLALISLFFPSKKFVFTEHNITNGRRKSNIFKIIERIIYRRYNLVTCISKAVHTELKQWTGTAVKSKLLYNFIDLAEIDNAEPTSRDDFNLSSTDRLLVMVGSFANQQKRQQDVIKTLNYLPGNFKLVLIGSGKRLSEYEELVEELALNNRVFFLGRRSDVYSVVKMCNYGVLASEWEGFGLVALEYMGCNLPSLGTNVAGLNEVINDSKCLFEIGQPKILAERIINIEKDIQTREKILELQYQHLEKFGKDRYFTALEELYSKLNN